MTKDIEEALELIKQALASVVGNLEVHNKIQEAVSKIEAELKPKK